MMQTKLDRLSYYDRLSYHHRAWHLEDCVESVCVAGVLIIRRLTALVEEISEEDNDIRLEVSADSTKPTRQVPTDDRYSTGTYRRQCVILGDFNHRSERRLRNGRSTRRQARQTTMNNIGRQCLQGTQQCHKDGQEGQERL